MVESYEVESVVRGYVYKEIWSGSMLPCLQERFNTHDSYAIGFTALLTASIHNNGTELANNPLELGKIASPLLSHVSNILTAPFWFPAVNISREKFSRIAINSGKFSPSKKTRYTV